MFVDASVAAPQEIRVGMLAVSVAGVENACATAPGCAGSSVSMTTRAISVFQAPELATSSCASQTEPGPTGSAATPTKSPHRPLAPGWAVVLWPSGTPAVDDAA